eukprot:TRINITY_DN11317_c0_g1_i1.p1 TRINITY_DN11317_c0_g1~~TRINITY_DN11317_c0_g1_i1.p1  ORF type:complete len:879 (+),score=242.60 TRINITY_DN11317_c0_g1_i1:75-2711(+)
MAFGPPHGIGERRRSRSDASPAGTAADLNPAPEDLISGSLGGAQASVLRREGSSAAPTVAAGTPLSGVLAPTGQTVTALAERRSDLDRVDPPVVADMISQVHRDRLRRARNPHRESAGAAADAPRQLAFTRVYGQVVASASETDDGLPPVGARTPPPDPVRAGQVESMPLNTPEDRGPPSMMPREPRSSSPRPAVDIRIVSLLEVCRRIRISLGALVGALAMSDDKREVRMRDDSPSQVGSLSASPSSRRGDAEPLLRRAATPLAATPVLEGERRQSVVMDINFGEEVLPPTHGVEDDPHDDSVSQPAAVRAPIARRRSSQIEPSPRAQAFGLMLSPGGVAGSDHQRVFPKPGAPTTAKNGFDEWRKGVLCPVNTSASQSQVTFEVPDPGPGARGHLSHEAYIVRDPSIPKGQPPQFVFAVATLPEDVLTEGEEGGCCRPPSEVESVTLYCDAVSQLDPGALPPVVLSVQLSQPTWAWLTLGFAVGCLSFVQVMVGRLVPHAAHETLVSVWWATAELFALAAVALAGCLTHRWSSAELLVFDQRHGSFVRRFWYLLLIIGLGIAGGSAQVLWANAFAAHPSGDAAPAERARRGAPSQAYAAHSLHPIALLAYRLARGQRIYTGEAIGVVGVLAGMALVAIPAEKHWDGSWGVADLYAAASAVCVAGWIILAKVLAAQAPASAILFVAALPGLAVNLIVAAWCVGLHGAGGRDGVFGWASGGSTLRWWLGLLLLSTAAKLAFVHALRYLHSIAVSVAQCVAVMLAVLWCEHAFDVEVSGGAKAAWSVPGLLVTLIGAALAAYTTSIRRLHVEVEVLPSDRGQHLAKRARPISRLTPSALLQKQRQEHGGRVLYHDAARGLRPEPRPAPAARRQPPPQQP